MLAAIKPLDLTQDEPVKLYEHGDLWLGRLRRLKQLGELPAGMLVPAEGHAPDDVRCYRAYTEILSELADLKVEVTEAGKNARILQFAHEHVVPT